MDIPTPTTQNHRWSYKTFPYHFRSKKESTRDTGMGLDRVEMVITRNGALLMASMCQYHFGKYELRTFSRLRMHSKHVVTRWLAKTNQYEIRKTLKHKLRATNQMNEAGRRACLNCGRRSDPCCYCKRNGMQKRSLSPYYYLRHCSALKWSNKDQNIWVVVSKTRLCSRFHANNESCDLYWNIYK